MINTRRRVATDEKPWVEALTLFVVLVLSVPISALIEGSTGFSTPGWFLAHYIVNPDGLHDLGAMIVIGFATDCALCCGMLWGIHVFVKGWTRFQAEAQKEREIKRQRSHPTQRANALVGSTLCATQLSFYVVLAVSACFHVDLFYPESLFAATLIMSFAACVAAIYALYALAVKLVFGIAFN
jgi:hypothetical protein